MLEKFLMELAWRLPRRLVYWCAVRLVSWGTTGRYEHQVVPELTALDALQRWNKESLRAGCTFSAPIAQHTGFGTYSE